MRDYEHIDRATGRRTKIADASNELLQHSLDAIKLGTAQSEPGASETLEDVRERILLEFHIRALGLR